MLLFSLEPIKMNLKIVSEPGETFYEYQKDVTQYTFADTIFDSGLLTLCNHLLLPPNS